MKTFFVDAFTNEPCKGNQAAICFPDKDLPDQEMLQIAAEIGFSETAFIKRRPQEQGYDIRFFSPKQEIPLCGHATLAAAHIVFETGSVNQVEFFTIRQVRLHVRQSGDWIDMEFPTADTTAAEATSALLQALGIVNIVEARYNDSNQVLMIEIESASMLKNLNPDFPALISSHQGINGVLVTAASGVDGYDYHYRYFWPWAGTNEDPVTGSVQTFLAPYWSAKLNKLRMKALQSSPRTGILGLEVKDGSVIISGQAVKILEGNLFLS